MTRSLLFRAIGCPGLILGLLATPAIVHGQAATGSSDVGAPTAAQATLPAHQVTYAEAGIRVTLTALVPGRQADAMTLTIENDRDTSVHVAALYGQTRSSASQAVLSDSEGHACIAEAEPVGIVEIPHLSQAPKPSITSMTAMPPRSRMNVVFRFHDCHLSGSSISFAGEFALSSTSEGTRLITGPVLGNFAQHVGAAIDGPLVRADLARREGNGLEEQITVADSACGPAPDLAGGNSFGGCSNRALAALPDVALRIDRGSAIGTSVVRRTRYHRHLECCRPVGDKA